MSDQEIVEMVFFPVVNEACRVMDEGVVVRASDLDIASVLGMSFPSYRFVPLYTILSLNFLFSCNLQICYLWMQHVPKRFSKIFIF